ncbi:MAG: SBBP repeat-containing protein, partial [Thermoplasmata archaeon]|nr:SBBP repeat-containing protein [Thermoplasmata archaeon]
MVEGELLNPKGVAVDEDGNIYVADSGNSRIQVFGKKGEFLRQISIPCDFSEISYTPSDVCIYNDLIFVSNTCKSNILIFDLEGNIIKTIGEKGGPGSNYFNFHGVKHYYQEFKEFLYPMGISVKDGDLLVADTGNSRIQVIQVKNLYDNNPPQIAITQEIPNLIADTSVNIYLKVIDDVSSPDKIQLFVKIDDNEWKEFNGNSLSLNNLSEGKHILLVKALDEAGNESEPLKIEFIVDTTPPNSEITSPEDNFYTNEETLNIKGSVSDSLSGVDKLTVNGEEVNIKDNGIFEKEITLSEGENKINIEAYDKAGNKQEKTLTVYLDKTPPELSVNIPD